MKKHKQKASSLRTILILMIISIIGLSAAGFYFVQDWFSEIATDINKSATTVSTTDNSSSQALKQVRDEIVANQSLVDKAESLVVPVDKYQQVVDDIKRYASNNDITISKYDLEEPQKTSIPSSTTISGITSRYITITIENPVPIKNLLQFFKAIETNSPILQIVGVNISRYQDSTDSVSIDPIIIEVYTK